MLWKDKIRSSESNPQMQWGTWCRLNMRLKVVFRHFVCLPLSSCHFYVFVDVINMISKVGIIRIKRASGGLLLITVISNEVCNMFLVMCLKGFTAILTGSQPLKLLERVLKAFQWLKLGVILTLPWLWYIIFDWSIGSGTCWTTCEGWIIFWATGCCDCVRAGWCKGSLVLTVTGACCGCTITHKAKAVLEFIIWEVVDLNTIIKVPWVLLSGFLVLL